MTRGERLAGGALLVLVVGLALHNALMAQLFELGLRGRALDAAAAWKEALLLAAVLAAAGNVRRLRPTLPDLLALVYTAVVCLYALLPQEVLGGEATGRGELLALRHHLLPVAAYALGRLLSPASSERERLGAAAALTAGLVALVGLADLALVSLDSWRRSGVPGWYREQLGLDYQGLSGLPENWVYNTGDEEHPLRRLVSTFLSPLASAYAFLVALLYVAARPLRWWWPPLAALLFVALLYTHTRAALLALVAGLLVLALAGRRPAPAALAVGAAALAAALPPAPPPPAGGARRPAPAALAVGAAALGAAFLAAYPALAPATSYTQAELEWQRENAQRNPGASGDPFSGSEASTRSHLRNLREGVATVLRHPQGYGLGNAGVVAKRTGVEIKAGESTYTELGVDAGLAGAAAFLLFGAALLRALWRRAPWVAASLAAVLLLALQTDVIGVHWLAVVVWAAAGLAVAARPGPPKAHEAGVVPGARAGESGGGGA